jgi:hypothetical protein
LEDLWKYLFCFVIYSFDFISSQLRFDLKRAPPKERAKENASVVVNSGFMDAAFYSIYLFGIFFILIGVYVLSKDVDGRIIMAATMISIGVICIIVGFFLQRSIRKYFLAGKYN